MAWALDLDGVVWLGTEDIPGAADAVAALQDAGETVLFVTNNSGRRVVDVEAKLASHGIEARGGVITSGMAAAALVEPGEVVLIDGHHYLAHDTPVRLVDNVEAAGGRPSR